MRNMERLLSNKLEKNKNNNKKPRPRRVAVPTHLHTWLRRRAAHEGEFIQDILVYAIEYYKNMVEQKKD
jgi:hypothetical protein